MAPSHSYKSLYLGSSVRMQSSSKALAVGMFTAGTYHKPTPLGALSGNKSTSGTESPTSTLSVTASSSPVSSDVASSPTATEKSASPLLEVVVVEDQQTVSDAVTPPPSCGGDVSDDSTSEEWDCEQCDEVETLSLQDEDEKVVWGEEGDELYEDIMELGQGLD